MMKKSSALAQHLHLNEITTHLETKMEQNKQNATPTESNETKKPGIAHRVGDAIEKIGDKIEHSQDSDTDEDDKKLAENESTKIGLKN
jgi:hypothetical protein